MKTPDLNESIAHFGHQGRKRESKKNRKEGKHLKNGLRGKTKARYESGPCH